MNCFFTLCLVSAFLVNTNSSDENQQTEVLKSVFNIEEFQNYLATPPRFVGTSVRQEILILRFPELKSQELRLSIRGKLIRIASEQEISNLKHDFFITINEFEINDSEAQVVLSYKNAKMYYEKKKKLVVEAQLNKTENDDWIVSSYEIRSVSLSTSD